MAKKPPTKLTKVWHVAVSTCMSYPDAVRQAHQDCLHQIIGHFGTTDVQIESTTVLVEPYINKYNNDTSKCIVTMIGYRYLDDKQLQGWRGWIGSTQYEEYMQKYQTYSIFEGKGNAK